MSDQPPRLYLTHEQARQLNQHAQSELPHEACGIIVGSQPHAARVVPIPNIAGDPAHQYQFEEAAFVRAIYRAHADGLELIGMYHSHPDGAPVPSPADVQQAYYPDTPYLIVGLKSGIPRLAAWQIRYGQVVPVELRVGEQHIHSQDESELSRSQKIAIVSSAILALVFMLLLSLSLLPPAPVILTPLP